MSNRHPLKPDFSDATTQPAATAPIVAARRPHRALALLFAPALAMLATLALSAWLPMAPADETTASEGDAASDEATPAEENADDKTNDKIDFARDIRPIFVFNCYKCHGPEKQEGGLRLDRKQNFVSGGDSGPAIVPGHNAASRLVGYVTGENDDLVVMPPDGEGDRLSAKQIALLRRWIDEGASWADGADLTDVTSGGASNHWSFQPLVRPPIPSRDKSAPPSVSAVDVFIDARLREQGLAASDEADRTTLIRRATFDLTGLAPTREEVEAFLADTRADAYERLVDRLLASPHYGERWGRHWLDLARYADSGGFEFDVDRPSAYRYRDWVIRALNDDMPYDQFIIEQLAGDEAAPGDPSVLVATGFCRNGPTVGNQENEKNRLDELDDVVSTTGAVFLGVTIGCARCHDHRFEPIKQLDYYRMLAVFNSMKTSDDDGRMAIRDIGSQPRPTNLLIRGDYRTPGQEVEPGAPAVLATEPIDFPQPDAKSASTLRRLTLARWIASPDNPLTARVMANRLWHYHFGRGLVETPSNLGQSGAEPSHQELLDWLAAELIDSGWELKPLHRKIMTSAAYRRASTGEERNYQADPQTVWLWRFPPRRLDAEEIRDSILASAGTLNLQMYGPGVKPRIDEAIIRTGSTLKWPIVESETPEHWRRTVYVFIKRSVLLPMMETFDAPTATQTCAKRLPTTISTQALNLMNNRFTNEQADYMAKRVVDMAGEDARAQVEAAHWLTFSRPPNEEQLAMAVEFLNQQRTWHAQTTPEATDVRRPAMLRALADLCHVLFNANEFVYVM